MPEIKRCRFCMDLEMVIDAENKTIPDELFATYKACLVQQTRSRSDPPGSKPRAQIAYKTRKLNYCPECGAHINWQRLTGGPR